MITTRTLNKLLKENGVGDNTEVTRHQGKYHLLHICKNGVPVPLIISKDITKIKDHIDFIVWRTKGTGNTIQAEHINN